MTRMTQIPHPPRDHATSTPPTSCTRIICCTWCRVPRHTRNAWSTRSTIVPETHRRVNELDAFGNPLIRIELAQPHRELTVVSRDADRGASRGPRCRSTTTEPWEKVRDSFAYRGAWPSRDQLDAARFRHESPHVRAEAGLHRLFGGVFPGRAARSSPARRRLSTQAARGHQVRAGRDHHQHRGHRSARDAARRLPGLRAPHDLLPALARPAGALRERLSAHQRARRPTATRETGRRRRVARLGVGVEPAVRLDRVRSDQRLLRGHRPHRRGLGPGLRRRVAAARRDPGRRRSQVVGDGARGADGGDASDAARTSTPERT